MFYSVAPEYDAYAFTSIVSSLLTGIYIWVHQKHVIFQYIYCMRVLVHIGRNLDWLIYWNSTFEQMTETVKPPLKILCTNILTHYMQSCIYKIFRLKQADIYMNRLWKQLHMSANRYMPGGHLLNAYSNGQICSCLESIDFQVIIK